MYKVETWVLKDVIKVLDGFNKPITSKSIKTYLKDRVALEKKAAKLSKLIKDNYTEVEI